eukprot:983261-Rhodomonas_salina.4
MERREAECCMSRYRGLIGAGRSRGAGRRPKKLESRRTYTIMIVFRVDRGQCRTRAGNFPAWAQQDKRAVVLLVLVLVPPLRQPCTRGATLGHVALYRAPASAVQRDPKDQMLKLKRGIPTR